MIPLALKCESECSNVCSKRGALQWVMWCCCISWCTRSAPPPPPSSRSSTFSCQAPPRSRRPPNGCRGRRGPIYCHSCEVSGACHFFRSGLTRVLYNGFPTNYNIDFIKFWWNTLQLNKITVQGVGWVSEFALKWSQMNRIAPSYLIKESPKLSVKFPTHCQWLRNFCCLKGSRQLLPIDQKLLACIEGE